MPNLSPPENLTSLFKFKQFLSSTIALIFEFGLPPPKQELMARTASSQFSSFFVIAMLTRYIYYLQ